MDDYTAKAKVMVKVLDFVKSGGAEGTRTRFKVQVGLKARVYLNSE